jgi:hypothetical protein
MKYAIGRIDTANGTLNRPLVKLPCPALVCRDKATFIVGNPETLAQAGYPSLVLCRYDPEDQFAYIVTMEEVQYAFSVEKAMRAV